jgi:predicted NBD/HSP70 family sugar kinase
VSADRPRIGIDLGGTKVEGIVLSGDGEILERLRRPAPQDDYEATLETVCELIRELESNYGELALGIGTPGSVSPATGRIKNANSTCLNGRPLRQDLEQRLARPVRLANDANCFALSEAIDGAGANSRVVFGVILGTGVGGGVIVDRKPLTGINAIAGEWGHNALPEPTNDERPGPHCYCGKRGCIESWLSGPGMTADHARATGVTLTAKEIAASETSDAANTLMRYAHRLSRALAMVINVLDPDCIVLGGGLSNIAKLYEQVPELWSAWVFSDRVDTRLLPPVHGDSGGTRGAAWLWPQESSGPYDA